MKLRLQKSVVCICAAFVVGAASSSAAYDSRAQGSALPSIEIHLDALSALMPSSPLTPLSPVMQNNEITQEIQEEKKAKPVKKAHKKKKKAPKHAAGGPVVTPPSLEATPPASAKTPEVPPSD